MEMASELRAQGASFVAQSKDHNPLDVVKLVVAEMPESDRKDRFAKFEQLIAEDEEYERAVRWYFFVNMHDYLTTKRTQYKSPDERFQQEVERREAVNNLKRRVVAVVLLDLMLPNGKLLRDATFGECAKAGGWFTKIAKKGKPSQVVGKVLSEQQLRAVK